MSGHLSRPAPIEIKIPNLGLVPKLDAIGAALAAVKEAHRDDMGVDTWCAIGQAQECIAKAILRKKWVE